MQEELDLKKKIIEIIYEAIDEHNSLNPENLKLEKSPETILLGINGNLDSLGLINLLLEIETKIKENIRNDLSIIDELLLLDENGPYKNINNLSIYILSKNI